MLSSLSLFVRACVSATLVFKRAAPKSGLLCVFFFGGGEGVGGVYYDLEERDHNG